MNANPIKLLLVEDDANDATIIRYFLAEGNDDIRFNIAAAGTLQAAERLFDERPFDVAILDLNLPDSNGIDTLLRARRIKPEVPVLVLTGLQDEAVALEALGMGAQDYLIKGMINGYFLKRSITHAIERARQGAQFENILAQDPDGKVILNGEGIVCYANAAAESLLCREEESLKSRPFAYPLSKETARVASAAGRMLEMRCSEIVWRASPATLVSLRDMTPALPGQRKHKKRLPAILAVPGPL